MADVIRHGEVLLFREVGSAAKRIEANIAGYYKKKDDNVIAIGESGHAHAVVDGEIYVSPSGMMFVKAGPNTSIQHLDAKTGAQAEHNKIRGLECGFYTVGFKREYDEELQSRRVLD